MTIVDGRPTVPYTTNVLKIMGRGDCIYFLEMLINAIFTAIFKLLTQIYQKKINKLGKINQMNR